MLLLYLTGLLQNKHTTKIDLEHVDDLGVLGLSPAAPLSEKNVRNRNSVDQRMDTL